MKPDFAPGTRLALARLALKDEDYCAAAEKHLTRAVADGGGTAEVHPQPRSRLSGPGTGGQGARQSTTRRRSSIPSWRRSTSTGASCCSGTKDAPERSLDLYKQYVMLSGGGVGSAPDAPVLAHFAARPSSWWPPSRKGADDGAAEQDSSRTRRRFSSSGSATRRNKHRRTLPGKRHRRRKGGQAVRRVWSEESVGSWPGVSGPAVVRGRLKPRGLERPWEHAGCAVRCGWWSG